MISEQKRPDLGELSKKGGRNLPLNHIMHIEGENWTHQLRSVNITYTTDVGGSGMQFSVFGDLEGYDDALITLWLGYGKWYTPYFQGRIQAPREEDERGISSAVAFGPFQTMGTQQLGTDETFIGKTLAWVVLEMARRASHAPGEVLVVNGDRYYIPAGEQFPFDNLMGDVLTTLCDKANFTAFDVPGGRRVVMPKPRPGSNANYKTSYSDGDYISFRLEPAYDMTYAKVIVYRNGQDGKPEVYSERAIEYHEGRRKPPPNRWYVVSDFVGDGAAAEQETYDLGVALTGGEKKFVMSCFFNPTLLLYDGFRAHKKTKNTMRSYSCSIDQSIELAYSPGEPGLMTLTGSAYELRGERKIMGRPRQDWVRSDGVLSRYDPEDDNMLEDVLILSEETIMGVL